jgi:hypothetical protein
MNEDLDLTSSRPQKKWFTKGRLLALILIIAAVLAGYLILVRSHSPAPDSDGYDEDQLPAIKVVILNGCGFEQLASEFAAAISQNNIEVVSLGDTPRPIYDKSIIVIRKGDMQDLKRLQKMTGITRWTSAQNEYHSADFDIIVGRDYESYIK